MISPFFAEDSAHPAGKLRRMYSYFRYLITYRAFCQKARQYFPGKDEIFMVDRSKGKEYDKTKQKRFGFWKMTE